MAKAKMPGSRGEKRNSFPHRRTSVGRSTNTRPKNKRARRSHKRYRGQG